ADGRRRDARFPVQVSGCCPGTGAAGPVRAVVVAQAVGACPPGDGHAKKPGTLTMGRDTWIALQSVALTDVHASWFDDVPAELVERARHSVPGRRWMAGQLAPRHALFAMPAPGLGEDERLATRAWLVQPLADRLDFLQELAATALAPWLRAQV